MCHLFESAVGKKCKMWVLLIGFAAMGIATTLAADKGKIFIF